MTENLAFITHYPAYPTEANRTMAPHRPKYSMEATTTIEPDLPPYSVQEPPPLYSVIDQAPRTTAERTHINNLIYEEITKKWEYYFARLSFPTKCFAFTSLPVNISESDYDLLNTQIESLPSHQADLLAARRGMPCRYHGGNGCYCFYFLAPMGMGVKGYNLLPWAWRFGEGMLHMRGA